MLKAKPAKQAKPANRAKQAKRAKKAKRAKQVHRYWRRHRWLGMTAALPLMVAAVSGMLLAWREPLIAAWPAASLAPWTTLYHIHRGLCAGAGGKALMSGIGVAVIFIFLSGIRLLVLTHRRVRSNHARFGLWLGLPLAAVCGLGALTNYSEPLADWLDPVPLGAAWSGGQPSAAAWQSARDAAAAQHEAGSLRQSYPPSTARPYYLFYYADGTRLYLNPYQYTMLKIRAPQLHWTSALLPLHSLRFLGAYAPLLSSLLALGLAGLSGRGILRLWARGRAAASGRHVRTKRFEAQAPTDAVHPGNRSRRPQLAAEEITRSC